MATKYAMYKPTKRKKPHKEHYLDNGENPNTHWFRK